MPRPDLGDAVGQNISRFIAGIFGLVFAGIGVAVIIFVWGFDDHAPVFFRIMATFISIAFIAMGGGIAFAAISGRLIPNPAAGARQMRADLLSQQGTTTQQPSRPVASVAYQCPSCAAPLAKDADVSPSGDVKCKFCNRWFNIHRPSGAA